MKLDKNKVILDLCGGTGSWSKPYVDAGYVVEVITLPEWDVREYAKNTIDHLHYTHVHGILAAPPCDHFSVSGAQYWKTKDQDGRTKDALDIVHACLDIVEYLNPVWWALENPVGRLRKLMSHRLIDLLGSDKPALMFNPCDFGDPYTKKTCLWGRFNLPKYNKVEPIRVCRQGSWLQKLGGKSEKTKYLRSITPPGFAVAFFEANK